MIRSTAIALFLSPLLLAGCDSVFGSKADSTTDEIFDAARRDPSALEEVEYIPLFPFFTQSGAGQLDQPTDVYVGYDELLYVTDQTGLHILDLAGRPAAHVPIAGGATSVIQDRRMNVYVTARRDTTLVGQTWNLPVVIRFDGITAGAPRIADIIWHPFDDDSRRFNRPDPVDTDLDVAFTGVAVLPDNNIYVSRQGPINDRSSILFPHNIVLEYRPDGSPLQAIVALNPVTESLRSAVYPTDVATFVHPPQRQSFSADRRFLVAQSRGPAGGAPIRFAALSIRVVETVNGTEFQPDAAMLQATIDPEPGESFFYDEFKFELVSDMTAATDGTNYIFVLDAGTNRVHTFTGTGVEGVAPPAGATTTRPVNVSFGSLGDGARQFNNPQGVAYFEDVLYVADTGNNRISRFSLNTSVQN